MKQGALPKLAVKDCWVRKEPGPKACRVRFLCCTPTKEIFFTAQGMKEAHTLPRILRHV